ncbi:hypothetical protein [Parapedobacter sp.]
MMYIRLFMAMGRVPYPPLKAVGAVEENKSQPIATRKGSEWASDS